jgi:hypothetical protein
MTSDSIVGRKMILCDRGPESEGPRQTQESGKRDPDWVLDSHMHAKEDEVVCGRVPEGLGPERIREQRQRTEGAKR